MDSECSLSFQSRLRKRVTDGEFSPWSCSCEQRERGRGEGAMVSSIWSGNDAFFFPARRVGTELLP